MVTRPVLEQFRDIELLRSKVQQYLDDCLADIERKTITLKSGEMRSYGKRPTVIGLCNYLGIDKSTFYRYLTEDKDSKGELTREMLIEIREILSRARGICEELTLQGALDGSVDARTASLVLAGFGYATKAEVETRSTVKVQGVTDEELREYMK